MVHQINQRTSCKRGGSDWHLGLPLLVMLLCIATLFSAGKAYATAADALQEPAEIVTEIPHTKTSGDSNYFTFAENAWTAGDSTHVWSNNLSSSLPAQNIWYEVKFVGHKIDVYAGKNNPMGMVEYFIDGTSKGEYSLHNNTNISSTKIATFDNLNEGEHTFKAVATGKRAAGTGNGNTLIDCAKVVVYHEPYAITGITVDDSSVSLSEGATAQISATVSPDYASASDLSFSSSDDSVAAVDENGLITAQGAGSATITVSAKMGEATATVSVTVAAAPTELRGAIVDTDSQYTQDRYNEVKDLTTTTASLSAWKNDIAVSEIALVTVDSAAKNLTLSASDFTADGNKTIGKDNVELSFIGSTKAYNGSYLGYGDPNRPVPEDNGSNRSESNDILLGDDPIDLGYNKVQPVWVKVRVPKGAAAGTYTGTVTVSAEGLDTPLTFTYTLTVQDATLPDSSEYKDTFDVELWQYPYSSAEYYNVEPFSEKHLDIMRSNMELYKEVGGHAITTSIVEEAWSGQTYSKNDVHYPSMVRWTKNADGSFSYDYTHFDKWVEFNRSLGIGDKIVLYSIAPWNNAIGYYENGTLEYEQLATGSDRWKKVWTDFLADIIDHLMEKGWFDDAYMGIDERGFSKEAFDLIDSVVNVYTQPLKTAGAMDNIAGKYDLAMRVDDLNVGDFAAQQNMATFTRLLADREAAGLRTTLYSCTEHSPGNFSLSAPVESYWSIANAGKQGTAGFLRWAYDAWVEDPLRDATHNAFEPGDCFLIYPDEKDAENPTSKGSVRLERIAEGVRDVNKIKLMTSEVSALEADADDLYAKVTTVANKSRDLLSSDARASLASQMNAFKDGIPNMTAKYIQAKASGADEVTSVTISGPETAGDQTIVMGETLQLTATVAPENVLVKTVTWKSANPDVATLDSNGLVTAVRQGTARITATSKKNAAASDTITVTVTMPQVEESARVAYYSFDDESAEDSWGSRNGTVNGATFADGKSGKALSATEEKNVTLGGTSGIGENDPWTVSYWVKSTAPLTDRFSVLMDLGKDFSFDLKMASDRDAGFHVGKNSGDVLTFKYPFAPNTWYHVTWTQSKQAGLSMYVNGKLVETNAWTKTGTTRIPLDIIGGTGFTGLIDEVKVYNRVLNAGEVSADMLTSGLNIAETEVSLVEGETYTIVPTVVSDKDDKSVTYSSSDESVATVDENGKVTAVKRGIAEITVKNEAAGYTDVVTVTVSKKLTISNTLDPILIDQDKYISEVYKPTDEQIAAKQDLYYGQPDMVRTKTGRLITMFPKGHGHGPLVTMISDDDGETWTQKTDTPKCWEQSQETPTLYALKLANGKERIMLITACPAWDQYLGGWQTSYSDDNGETWTDYKHWHPNMPDGSKNYAVVGMASLIQLKDENGNYIQKWMGVYHHQNPFTNYKTYLTFDENGNEQWSAPEMLLPDAQDIEKSYQMCEIGMFRSPDGKRIVGLARSQSHNNPATLIYSDDEGETWSRPMDLPGTLAGERHKAMYDPVSGRLVITFREILYDKNGNNQFDGADDWVCGDWGAWVGTYEQLMNQEEGDYRLRLSEDWANNRYSGDTGYTGMAVLEDGTFILNTYGHWDKNFSQTAGMGVTSDLCWIRQAKFKLGEIENDRRMVSYEELESELADAKALLEKAADGGYTEESVQALSDAIAAVEDGIAAKDLQQVQVDALAVDLQTAMDGLAEETPEPEPEPEPDPDPEEPQPGPEDPEPRPDPDPEEPGAETPAPDETPNPDETPDPDADDKGGDKPGDANGGKTDDGALPQSGDTSGAAVMVCAVAGVAALAAGCAAVRRRRNR